MAYTYEYPHFGLTVDAVVFAEDGGVQKVLLIQRGKPPFQGQWALPGGYVNIDETTIHAAYRELEEETGIREIALARLDVFDAVNRDPRERTVSVAYTGTLHKLMQPTAQDDAADARWFDISDLPPLAFDHSTIIACALSRL